MNSPRILDIMPTSATSGAPPGAKPPTREPQSVPEVRPGSEGGAGVPDAARRRVDEERERVAAEGQDVAVKESRQGSAWEIPQSKRNFANRVGYFDGSSIIFVDLVDERTQRELMRIFGPSRAPTEDPTSPEKASQAYETTDRRRAG